MKAFFVKYFEGVAWYKQSWGAPAQIRAGTLLFSRRCLRKKWKDVMLPLSSCVGGAIESLRLPALRYLAEVEWGIPKDKEAPDGIDKKKQSF